VGRGDPQAAIVTIFNAIQATDESGEMGESYTGPILPTRALRPNGSYRGISRRTARRADSIAVNCKIFRLHRGVRNQTAKRAQAGQFCSQLQMLLGVLTGPAGVLSELWAFRNPDLGPLPPGRAHPDHPVVVFPTHLALNRYI
jgi:hypothetical protein